MCKLKFVSDWHYVARFLVQLRHDAEKYRFHHLVRKFLSSCDVEKMTFLTPREAFLETRHAVHNSDNSNNNNNLHNREAQFSGEFRAQKELRSKLPDEGGRGGMQRRRL